MHKAGLDPLRVASDATLQPCAVLETFPVVPQVMQDLEVPHGLLEVAILLICHFCFSLSICDGNCKSFSSQCLPRSGCSTLRRRTRAGTAGLTAPLGNGVCGREALAKVPHALVGV